MTQAAPGWYDDGTGRLRWWDGAAWSGDLLDPASATPAAAAPVPEAATSAPTGPEEFPWMREAAEREQHVMAGAGAIPSTAVAGADATADPIRSLRIDRSGDEVDPVVAWARQQAAAQAQAEARPESRVEAPEQPLSRSATRERGRRPRRRALPWVLGGALGVALLAGAGAITLVVVNAPDAAIDPSAASVVETYNELWAGGDCAAMQAIGSEAFLADVGWTDCDSFAENQRAFLLSYEDYRVSVEETVVQGEVAWVDTSERFFEPDGDEERIDRYRYELVRNGDGWLIDSLSAR